MYDTLIIHALSTRRNCAYNPAMREKIVHVSLRLPESIHREVIEWADREHRSLHSQVLHTLLEALERDKAARAASSQRVPPPEGATVFPAPWQTSQDTKPE